MGRALRVPRSSLPLALAVAWSGTAWGQLLITAGHEVELNAPPCESEPYDRARLVQALRVELAQFGIADVVIAGSAALDLASGRGLAAAVVMRPPYCQRDNEQITIEIDDMISQQHFERHMSLSDLTLESRPRAIAIAVAEQLAARWSELEPAKAKPDTSARDAIKDWLTTAPASPSWGADPAYSETSRSLRPASEAARSRPEVAFEASFRSRMFPAGSALLGPELGLRGPVGDALLLHSRADLGIDQTSDNGSVVLAALTVGASLATDSTADLELGPRMTLGHVFDGSSFSRPDHLAWLLALGATLRTDLDRHRHAFFGLELGYALASVDASGDSEIRGAFIGAHVGLAMNIGK